MEVILDTVRQLADKALAQQQVRQDTRLPSGAPSAGAGAAAQVPVAAEDGAGSMVEKVVAAIEGLSLIHI
eukprot:11105819-Alexandrium_andersonii.AAC.1